jgi:hypothetical protein
MLNMCRGEVPMTACFGYETIAFQASSAFCPTERASPVAFVVTSKSLEISAGRLPPKRASSSLRSSARPTWLAVFLSAERIAVS